MNNFGCFFFFFDLKTAPFLCIQNKTPHISKKKKEQIFEQTHWSSKNYAIECVTHLSVGKKQPNKENRRSEFFMWPKFILFFFRFKLNWKWFIFFIRASTNVDSFPVDDSVLFITGMHAYCIVCISMFRYEADKAKAPKHFVFQPLIRAWVCLVWKLSEKETFMACKHC